ncbi:hypothetical protein ACFOGI_14805 [Virgibacillus xinjiangensis]|uniref:Fur-regulated basic protein A n=1 Tax=Virgibacillus xinjiangensis TaxID=393090 RepID=A0ABV7CYY9_9BACI
MGEQERYKHLLKKVIDETENSKIKSSQELVQTLIRELSNPGEENSIRPQNAVK